MKDAFGGILNLAIIVAFLVIVIGVLGLTVSYTKAFKMKNNVISRIEQYDGIGCFETNGACFKRILDDARSIGYSPTSSLNCGVNFDNVQDYFCYKGASSVEHKNGLKYTYYEIATQVDINIPIVNKIMGMSFFQVNGVTRNVSMNIGG